MERFMVAKNDASYKSTPHKHKLNFIRSTKVWKVTATKIPMNHFDFVSFEEILSRTSEDQLIGKFCKSFFVIHRCQFLLFISL
jgi:hypothetical protein